MTNSTEKKIQKAPDTTVKMGAKVRKKSPNATTKVSSTRTVKVPSDAGEVGNLFSEKAEYIALKAEHENLKATHTELLSTVSDLNQKILHLNNNLIAYQNYTSMVSKFQFASSKTFGIESSITSDIPWVVKTALTRGPKQALKLYAAFRYLSANNLFDPVYYARQINNDTLGPTKLLRHYLITGFQSGLDPSSDFSVKKYLDYYPDVKAAGVEPCSHYHRYGKSENRIAPSTLSAGFNRNQESVARLFFNAASSDGVSLGLLSEKNPFEALRHEWRTQQNPDLDSQTLGLYEVRPEDDVPVEGRRGDVFAENFALHAAKPDFASAVAHLNGLTPKPFSTAEAPDVSIIIPIYGQLAYTLNCLHSLVEHTSRYSFEIIVGDDRSPDESEKWLPKLSFIKYIRHEVNGGFIENCNRSSQAARGQYIIFLNNDTRVVSRWLDELIGTFDIFPKAGLVGSKLFYPDGSLQEAGGILWRDGSAWNFGRNDDPNRPRYCYARQIDYISGCSIAVPTKIWQDLKGFDTLYRPAYCEDSDLCFRVREAGFETWLQPLSRLIHYEGKTSGTDVGHGIKAYQVENTVKLFKRWRKAIAKHRPNGIAPWLEYERKVKKRVLIIDATNPAPWRDAGSVTLTTTITIYQVLGYKVTFLPQDNFLFEPRQVHELQRKGVECVYAPYEVLLSEFLKRQGHMFDIVQVFRVGVMEKCIDDIRVFAPQARIVFHVSDLHFLRLEREASLSRSKKAQSESQEIKKRELALVAKADCTIVHSPVEAELIGKELPTAPTVIFPVVADCVGTNAGFDARKDIIFLGGYGHEPNIDAVEFFVTDIWPLLKPKLPADAKFLIVGSQPSERVKALASDRVIVTGMVEDLKPWFDRSRVFAAPIRYGAGVKGKVTTAMAHGLPIVATPCAAEGMYLSEGETVIVAETASAFADAVLALYNDGKKWKSMSDASLKFVKTRNSFEMGVSVVRALVDKANARYAERRS